MRDIVADADREVVLRPWPRHFVEDGLDHGGRELLEESPYRPPITRGTDRNGELAALQASLTAATTSRYSGSPALPGSLVDPAPRASTLAGSAARKCSTENGRCSPTFSTPTRSPGYQGFHGLLRGLGAGAHQDEHALGVGGPGVVEEAISPSGETPSRSIAFCTIVGHAR